MPKVVYQAEVVERAKILRSLGKTYGEISKELKIVVPKSTLSYWFKNVPLPDIYEQRVKQLNVVNLHKGRTIAHEINKLRRKAYFESLDTSNSRIVGDITNRNVAKIALSMLYLGEGLHSKKSRSFYFGNSSPVVITLFLELLKLTVPFQLEKVRCTVQCRADQDREELVAYWSIITNIPKKFFYQSRIDPRTVGKPTTNKEYKGVLRIDYFDTKVRDDLESLANLIYNHVAKSGPIA